MCYVTVIFIYRVISNIDSFILRLFHIFLSFFHHQNGEKLHLYLIQYSGFSFILVTSRKKYILNTNVCN